MAGYNLQVLDEAGEQKKAGELGNLVIKLPLPPGTLPKIWGDEERYREGYLSHYPGYYLSGDSGMIDDDGYVHIMSRMMMSLMLRLIGFPPVRWKKPYVAIPMWRKPPFWKCAMT